MESITSKNIWYTSISIIISSIFTYIFWFLAARLGGAEPVGVASSIASLVIIISTIAGLDMSLGMKRMMGLAISARDISEFKEVLVSTVIFVTILVTVSSALILIPEFRILETLGIGQQYSLITVAMIYAQSFQYIFMEAIIAALQSRKLVIPFLLGSLARFPVILVAYFMSYSLTTGVVVSFSALLFITSLCFGVYLIKFMHGYARKPNGNFYFYVKRTLRAGLASWIPHVLNVAGYWLGILAVFSSEGASDGGRFYISVGIFAVTLFVVTGVTKVIHALIPRIRDEKEQVKFLIYYTNIAFVFTMPFAVPLLYFSSDFLGLMGKEFVPAGASLSIFILSLPFVVVSEMIYYFAYGKGDHKSVLYLGLIGNVPRIVLYFVLAHFFGINGAAMSFFIGSVLQLVASLRFAKQHQIEFDSHKYLAFTLIPIAVGLSVWIVNINFVVSTAIIIVASFLLYVRFLLVTTDEVHEIIYAVLPHDLAADIYPHFAKIVTKIASQKKSHE